VTLHFSIQAGEVNELSIALRQFEDLPRVKYLLSRAHFTPVPKPLPVMELMSLVLGRFGARHENFVTSPALFSSTSFPYMYFPFCPLVFLFGVAPSIIQIKITLSRHLHYIRRCCKRELEYSSVAGYRFPIPPGLGRRSFRWHVRAREPISLRSQIEGLFGAVRARDFSFHQTPRSELKVDRVTFGAHPGNLCGRLDFNA